MYTCGLEYGHSVRQADYWCETSSAQIVRRTFEARTECPTRTFCADKNPHRSSALDRSLIGGRSVRVTFYAVTPAWKCLDGRDQYQNKTSFLNCTAFSSVISYSLNATFLKLWWLLNVILKCNYFVCIYIFIYVCYMYSTFKCPKANFMYFLHDNKLS